MKSLTNEQLTRMLKTEREEGLSEGCRLGYQAGIIEGIHRQTLVNTQINQILGDK